MQFGFYTAVLGDRPLTEVAEWAARSGFATLELDVESHGNDSSQASRAVATVRHHGLDVCALTYFGNLLDCDNAARDRARAIVQDTIDAAADNGVGIVVVFPGRDDTASEDDNYHQLAEYVGPLAERAAQGGVKIAIENWPGPRNDYVATTPEGWARLFSLVPHPNLGLLFDPSHLVWQGIDYKHALRAVAERVVLAHAKDTEIFPARLQQTGYFGRGWWSYRLPGHGTIDWQRLISLLGQVGFDGVVSIEHEDPTWGATSDGTVERRQDGLREGLRVLRAAASLTAGPN